ncbi:MAG TPA: MMPL family transporter [Ilumatobacteraceae bacterium]|nr:MMPL family transporter [Ilumatobacteraceae bacterium]
MIERLASACARHRVRTLVVWIAVLIGVVAIGGTVTSGVDVNDRLDGADSQRAYDLAAVHMPGIAGSSTTVVFKTDDLAATAAVVDEIRALPRIDHVDGPLDHPEQVGSGGISFAAVAFSRNGPPSTEETAAAIERIAASHRTDGLQIALGGDPFVQGDVPATEGIGLAAAIVILLIAFGSVVAMGLPIVSALIGIGLSLSAIPLIAAVLPTADFTSTVAAMIGLGVGIDYALFMVTRYRAEFAAGGDVPRAIVTAVRTSGRAIAFAGGTVVISLLGLLLIGMDFLNGFAIASSLTVAIAVVAAITLVPALLAIIGRRIDRLSIHRKGHTSLRRDALGRRWARLIQRHPVTAVITGGAALLLAALPVLGMRLAVSDQGNDPSGSTTRVAYDRLADGFGPGFNGPLFVVSEDVADAGAIAATVRATDGVAFVTAPQASADRAISVLTAYPTTSPQSEATDELVRHLRDELPDTVHIGGQTASGIDFSAFMGQRLPWFIGAVLLVSFLLLLAVFRSLLVPLKAVVLNLVSIGAAYGAMVAVFQWGWFSSLLDIEPAPIEPWAPMMLFAIVFGLSMDYEVFLLSAVKERYDQTRDNHAAVVDGLSSTARVITAAAAIMVCVFASFMVADLRSIKLIGFGLAAAVFIDATIVRLVMVPATMELLGRWNWWLPRRLQRALPNVNLGHELS